MAIVRNLRIEKNADFQFAARWVDGDTEDGWTLTDAVFMVRYGLDDTAPALDASVSNGRITLAAEGWAVVLVLVDDLADLEPVTAKYDLVVTRQVDNRVFRLYEGDIVISEGVAHA